MGKATTRGKNSSVTFQLFQNRFVIGASGQFTLAQLVPWWSSCFKTMCPRRASYVNDLNHDQSVYSLSPAAEASIVMTATCNRLNEVIRGITLLMQLNVSLLITCHISAYALHPKFIEPACIRQEQSCARHILSGQKNRRRYCM